MKLPNTAHEIVHEITLPNAAHTSRPGRGKVCFAAIAPFRYLIVYPPLMRSISQEWQAGMLWAGVSPKASMPQEA